MTKSESVSCSVLADSATPWSVTHQAPLSIGFSRQAYWSGLPFSSPGELLHAGVELESPTLRADSLHLHFIPVGCKIHEASEFCLLCQHPCVLNTMCLPQCR